MSGIHDLNPATELRLVQGLGDLPPDALAELASLVVQRRVPAQELASEQGHVPLGLMVLVRGAAKTVRSVQTTQGEVLRVLDVMRASSIVPEPAVFDGLPAEASVIALRASHFFVIERRAFHKLMAVHPAVERAVLGRFIRESRVHVRRFDELASGSVEERVHRLLEALSAQHGTPLGQGRFIALPLRRRDIASMVNATTETVSRLLAKLEREGRARSTRDGIWWRGSGKPAPSAPPDSTPSVTRSVVVPSLPVVPFAPPVPTARDGRG